jgi:5-methylcytosine-specific restriction endonuclease McrA
VVHNPAVAQTSESQDARRARRLEAKRRYREANRERLAAKQREYVERNREEVNAGKRARRYEDHEATKAREREYARAYYAANAERLRAQRRMYERERFEAVKDAINERRRARRAEAPEIARSHARRWRAANLDAERERYRRYYAEHRAELIARATGRGMDPEWVAVLLDDPCCYCGGPMGHVDHIVPITAGGAGEWMNLTAACGPCNQRKHTKSLLLFLRQEVACAA